MFKKFCVLSVLALSLYFSSCSKAHTQTSKNNWVIDYTDEKDEYTVVALKTGKTNKTAKERALKRAAELSYDNGYKYFMVLDETTVSVIPGKEGWPSAYDFPQNLYEEEIVQKGYNRERFIEGSKENNKTYPALQLKIKAISKPRAKAYRVCDIIKCSN